MNDFRRVARLAGRATRMIVGAPGDALLSTQMAAWLVVVSVAARTTTLPRTHRLVSWRARRGSPGERAHSPADLARAIDRLLRLDILVFRPSCWRRALVLHRFLARAGVPSRVNFGLRREADGEWRGHAWLEHDGQPLLENDASGYVVTFSLPHVPQHSGTITTGPAGDVRGGLVAGVSAGQSVRGSE